MTTVLVTGGPGSLGRPLRRRLVAEGHQVRRLVRSSAAAEEAAAGGAQPALSTLPGPSRWSRPVSGNSEVLFLETVYDRHGVDTCDVTDVGVATVETAVPVPALWSIGQTCSLSTDRAVRDLGRRPADSRADAVAALRTAPQEA